MLLLLLLVLLVLVVVVVGGPQMLRVGGRGLHPDPWRRGRGRGRRGGRGQVRIQQCGVGHGSALHVGRNRVGVQQLLLLLLLLLLLSGVAGG